MLDNPAQVSTLTCVLRSSLGRFRRGLTCQGNIPAPHAVTRNTREPSNDPFWTAGEAAAGRIRARLGKGLP